MIALGLTGCLRHRPQATATPEASVTPRAPQVTVAPVHSALLASDTSLQGAITAESSVNVTSDAAGRITNVNVELGQAVSKGQPLLTLDTIDTQRQLAVDRANVNEALTRLGLDSPNQRLQARTEVPSVQKAKATLDDAYETYNDYLDLRHQDLVSDTELSNVRKNYLTARADYQTALQQVDQGLAQIRTSQATLQQHSEKLKQAVVRSPIQGVIQQRLVAPGDYLQVGQKSGLVVVGGTLYVTVPVPQRYLSRLATGRSVEVTCDAFPEARLKAVVSQISPVANPRTRTIEIRARLVNPPRWAVPGLDVNVRMATSQSERKLFLPQSAILSDAGRSKVFRVKRKGSENQVEAVWVRAGQVVGDDVEVQGDLKLNDLVVTDDLAAMEEGRHIDIVPAAGHP